MGFLGAMAALLGSARPCALCGDRLGARYLVDSEGKGFCLCHGSGGVCRECGRIGARPTPDGARLCRACASSGVEREDHARAILAQVHRDLQALGFRLPTAPVPIRLVPRRELADGPAGEGGQCEGRIFWRRRGREEPEILEMLVLRGLPPVSSGRIIAHELGHAWLLQDGCGELPPMKAEGACELCAWLWLTSRNRPNAAFKAEAMNRNRDPVYGDGFRAARQRYQTGGMASLRRWLAAERRPGGTTFPGDEVGPPSGRAHCGVDRIPGLNPGPCPFRPEAKGSRPGSRRRA